MSNVINEKKYLGGNQEEDAQTLGDSEGLEGKRGSVLGWPFVRI